MDIIDFLNLDIKFKNLYLPPSKYLILYIVYPADYGKTMVIISSWFGETMCRGGVGGNNVLT